VCGIADSLRSASTVAGEGANEIYAVRQSVLYAVEDAEGAGFTVGEDLSVISRQTGGPPALQAARQAQAQALAADIRAKAATLTATDQDVAAKVTTAAAGLRGVTLGAGTAALPIAMPPSASRGSRQSTSTSGGRDSAMVANHHSRHQTPRSAVCLPRAFGRPFRKADARTGQPPRRTSQGRPESLGRHRRRVALLSLRQVPQSALGL
jgi:hypothetical protein